MKRICLLTFAAVVSAADRRLIIDGSIEGDTGDPYGVVMMYCRTLSTGEPYVCGLMCSGSLIAPNVVLTAGHCIRKSDPAFQDPSLEIQFANTFVLLGSSDYDKADWSTNSRIVRVENAVHHGYGDNIRFPFDGDIALLKLAECVTLVPGLIETIKVSTPQTDSTGESCSSIRAVGYGMVSNAPDPLNDSDGKRRFIEDVVNPFQSCKNAYIAATMDWSSADGGIAPSDVSQSVVPDSVFCAGGASVHSVCYGDSGGPIVSKFGDSLQVVGATSFGFGAACTLSPDYSTRVSFHAEWIRSMLESSSFTQCPNWNIEDSFTSWPVTALTESDLSSEFKASRCMPHDGTRWQCLSGPCIDIKSVCDGKADCADKSDEDYTFCSYVRSHPSARRLAETGGHDELLNELDALIASQEPSAVVIKASFEKVSELSKAKPSTPRVQIAGILKSRSLRLKKDKTFLDTKSLVPIGGKSVDCMRGLANFETCKQRAVEANTIDDQWDAIPLKNACTDLLTCVGGQSTAGVSEGKQFCSSFLEYVAANSSLAYYADNFKARFNAYCPGDDTSRSVGDTPPPSNTRGVEFFPGGLGVIFGTIILVYIVV